MNAMVQASWPLSIVLNAQVVDLVSRQSHTRVCFFRVEAMLFFHKILPTKIKIVVLMGTTTCVCGTSPFCKIKLARYWALVL